MKNEEHFNSLLEDSGSTTFEDDNLIIIENVKLDITQDKGIGSGLVISGLAIPFGTYSRNGVMYSENSVKATHQMLDGRSMLLNHDVNSCVGHVLSTKEGGTYTKDGEGLYYRGDINPEIEINGSKLVTMIRRGDVTNVSISIMPNKNSIKEMGDDKIMVEIDDWIELSVVTTPGFTQTTMKVMEQVVGRLREMAHTRERKSTDKALLEEYEIVDKELIKNEVDYLKENEESLVLSGTFGGYKDFAQCVKANQDKESPEGFCAWLHKKATGKWPSEQGHKNDNSIENQTGETMPKTKQEEDKEPLEEEVKTDVVIPLEERLTNLEILIAQLIEEKDDKKDDDDEDDDEEEKGKKKDKESIADAETIDLTDLEEFNRRLTEVEQILIDYSPYLETLKEKADKKKDDDDEEEPEEEKDEDKDEKIKDVEIAKEQSFSSSPFGGKKGKRTETKRLSDIAKLQQEGIIQNRGV